MTAASFGSSTHTRELGFRPALLAFARTQPPARQLKSEGRFLATYATPPAFAAAWLSALAAPLPWPPPASLSGATARRALSLPLGRRRRSAPSKTPPPPCYVPTDSPMKGRRQRDTFAALQWLIPRHVLKTPSHLLHPLREPYRVRVRSPSPSAAVAARANASARRSSSSRRTCRPALSFSRNTL